WVDVGVGSGLVGCGLDRQFQNVFSVCGTCQRDGTQGRDFGESYIPCSHRFSSSRRSRSLMLQASSRLDARGSQCRLYGSSLCKSWHYSKRTMAATIVSWSCKCLGRAITGCRECLTPPWPIRIGADLRCVLLRRKRLWDRLAQGQAGFRPTVGAVRVPDDVGVSHSNDSFGRVPRHPAIAQTI